MRILVTRSELDSPDTAARLEALGHTVMQEPLLRIEFARAPSKTFRPGAIVFTSRNAVRAIGRWPTIEAWRDVPVFTVGEETGNAASEIGFADVKVGDGDAAALAELVGNAFDPARGTILYPAAEEPAADLEGMLSSKGFSVLQVNAYRSVPATEFSAECRAAIEKREIDGAVFFSRRTAATFRDIAKATGLVEQLQGTAFYCLSEQIAKPLRHFGDANTHVAPSPDAESLFALLDGKSRD